MTAPKLSVLLSEGASTSAREAVTALGLRGHHIEVVDPQWRGLVVQAVSCEPVSAIGFPVNREKNREFGLEPVRDG